MSQAQITERQKPRVGKEAKEDRRRQIHKLILIVHGNRHWRDEFCKAYPEFDNKDGINLLNYATRGRADAPELLAALQAWIPKIQAEQPEWFVKQLAIDVP